MHVYILQRPDGLIKIGFSTDPTKRLRSLETQGGFDAASAWVSVPVENAKAAERKTHQVLSEHRVIGEWFQADFDDAIQAVIDAMRGDESEKAAPGDAKLDSFPSRLASALKAHGLTQKALAESLRIAHSTVCRWVSGQFEASLENIEQISAVLDVSPAWLAFGHGPVDESALQAADILAPLTPAQRAQALRMLEAFAASCASEGDE